MFARSIGVIGFLASLVLVLSGAAQNGTAQDKSKTDLAIHGSLREVINAGADMFNLQADYAGCYRLYQGSLIAIKPMLKPAQQTAVDKALADAAAKPAFADRAHHLRLAIDSLREQLQPSIPQPPDLKGMGSIKAPELIQTPPKKIGK